MSPVRVYVVEENRSVRMALVDRLSHVTGVEVIGHTGDAAEVVPQVGGSCPDVVLIEVKRSDGMGLELLRQLAALDPTPRLIVLTSYPSNWERDAARRAGADMYLLKDIQSEELLRQIMSGDFA